MWLSLLAIIVLANSGLSPQVSSLPDPAGITIRNAKVETLMMPTPAGSIAGAPDSNPNRLPLPTDASAEKVDRIELHAYSFDLTNNGPKAIKALAWDFIFADPATDKQLLRHSFANVQQIDIGKHKTIKFTTSLSEPKTVTIDMLKTGKTPQFLHHAMIQCLLFADGSTWQAQAGATSCERLQRWMEQRKNRRSLLEDFPFNP
jgi:hypothetical protein